MPDTRLSLIIVCFGGDVLPLLDAIGRQRAAGDEVIVVDNLAPAGGTTGVAKHPQVDRLVEAPTNLGFAAGVNAGARLARGATLAILNPDLVPEPGCLDRLREPPPDWVAWTPVVTLPGGALINTAGGVANVFGFAWVGRFREAIEDLPPNPYETGFLTGAALCIRRSVWEDLGGFTEHYFMYHEDVELSHRLRLTGLRFGVVPDARAVHDYVFLKGGTKWRRLERNRWCTVVRTYPGPLLTMVLPAMLAAEPLLLLLAARGGWLLPKLGSWLDVMRWLPHARAERREVQRAVSVSAAAFAQGLTPALDSPLLGRVAEMTWLQAALAAYWRAVTLALTRCP